MADEGVQAAAPNERQMARNLTAQRNQSAGAALEQAAPSLQFANQMGGAFGIGGSAKSDEEYNMVDALWDVLTVTIMLIWGEGMVPLTSWLMEGMSAKNVKRFIIFLILLAILVLAIIVTLVVAVNFMKTTVLEFIPGLNWFFD